MKLHDLFITELTEKLESLIGHSVVSYPDNDLVHSGILSSYDILDDVLYINVVSDGLEFCSEDRHTPGIGLHGKFVLIEDQLELNKNIDNYIQVIYPDKCKRNLLYIRG